jgi:hypothetical protein
LAPHQLPTAEHALSAVHDTLASLEYRVIPEGSAAL